MKRLFIAGISLFLFLWTSLAMAAPDGEYRIQLQGSDFSFKGNPSSSRIREKTAIILSSQGENITLKMDKIGSVQPATVYKGKWNAESGDFVALWWHGGYAYETKLIHGTIRSNQINGTLLYPRITNNLTPGYLNLYFSGTKDKTREPIQSEAAIQLSPKHPSISRGDCITFDPARLKVQNSRGKWILIDKHQVIMNFDGRQQEAQNASEIIKHYSLNQVCFVGRPEPFLSYWLNDGQAPSGSLPKEDCIPFVSSRLQVQQMNKNWKMVDENSVLLDFGPNRAKAYEALTIIKSYRFRYHCFVGRPHPTFEYWRR